MRSDVTLQPLDETSLRELLDAAVADADPLEVMPPVDGPAGWTAGRRQAFLDFHRARSLSGEPVETTYVIRRQHAHAAAARRRGRRTRPRRAGGHGLGGPGRDPVLRKRVRYGTTTPTPFAPAPSTSLPRSAVGDDLVARSGARHDRWPPGGVIALSRGDQAGCRRMR
ncbi:hypothetical protein Ppa06_67000 [Planomonospora parontospora subsp. parontospora]|uniref:Uncharacterized protein n=2 Tax=Planomonospora parontospora TaxID=58119 RepID=A0AA37BNS8_9ACTN|nr:hypothetical protein GCM10010126_67680 [Planomonospora parontospora]GII12902.1 hypothetical protein Ppa06_67000 [Planomonospora parontospora subsp. parontospora]